MASAGGTEAPPGTPGGTPPEHWEAGRGYTPGGDALEVAADPKGVPVDVGRALILPSLFSSLSKTPVLIRGRQQLAVLLGDHGVLPGGTPPPPPPPPPLRASAPPRAKRRSQSRCPLPLAEEVLRRSRWPSGRGAWGGAGARVALLPRDASKIPSWTSGQWPWPSLEPARRSSARYGVGVGVGVGGGVGVAPTPPPYPRHPWACSLGPSAA